MIVLPDIIEPTIDYLNGVTEVTALVDDRIGTRLPDNDIWPAVRIDATGGIAAFKDRLDQSRLQIHAFATTDVAAMTVARIVRAAIDAMENRLVPDVVCFTTVDTSSPRFIDDTSRTPPISQATFSATVTVRSDP